MSLPASSMSAVFLMDILSLWVLKILSISDLFLTFVLLIFAHIAMCVLVTRMLMFFFPIIEGEFLEGSREVARWRAQAVVALLGCIYFDPVVPLFLKPFWYRMFGAKIAKGVAIGGRLVDCSLTVLNAGSGIGADAMILGHWLAGGRVRLGTVIIEENAMIGAKALIFPGVRIGTGATIGAMSLVISGQVVPAKETWVGIPARKIEKRGCAL